MNKSLIELPIDYHMLGEAQAFYARLGYKKIEIPWIVSPQASTSTVKAKNNIFILDDGKHMISSAEQGFVELMLNQPEKIESDFRYQAIAPCFRRETPDHIHATRFMKLELFAQVKNVAPIDYVNKFLNDAKTFFELLNIEVEQISIGEECCFDLVAENDVGLGSYGVRKRTIGDKKLTWVYGTGLALPRTQIIKPTGVIKQLTPEKN